MIAACGAGEVHTSVTTQLVLGASEPVPASADDHIHATPVHTADFDHLYVEVTSDQNHGEALRKSAAAGLVGIPNTVFVDDGGDVELHAVLANLTPVTNGASCKVKIYVLRLPQHDLLAIADGGAQVTGAGPDDACISTIGATIVKQKLPPLLARQLEAK